MVSPLSTAVHYEEADAGAVLAGEIGTLTWSEGE